MEDKKLSDDEIERIAKQVTAQIEQDLYINVGSGIVALAWRGFLLVAIGLAAYGINSRILHLFS